ncbi:Gfo/Idh/MocA family oxidoreductase [Sulfurimonas sp. SAG-AH-194-C20]|nr:Gfo/Idh/MocA family oxidoreductase [Sulfurimonas sp. SAG-AH-194-C20]MDF1879567.1 Gfo/Idh/MocA family oxidoreductase [Sulfurimonas sp. SAG-AH-194-C20]
MKTLLIGYGSIGKRHEEVLLDLGHAIDIISSQEIREKTVYKNLSDVKDLKSYDYYVIASPTYKHYEQLKYLESEVAKKTIFCEKPLFEEHKTLEVSNNSVYVGYVLRFHPLLEKLKMMLKKEKILSINVNSGQYLPTWRVGSDYRDSYSAKKSEGGGVLLDLSHEIDYMQWLCGTIVELKSYQVKISDLEIDSDDMTTFIGKTLSGILVNLSVDYISKIVHREIILHTVNFTYILDFINNTLQVKDKSGNEELFESKNLERNEMFTNMHKAIMAKKQNVCTYSDGVNVMKTILKIQEQNNE